MTLKKLRGQLQLKGWTQHALASALGVTQAHVSFVLNGHRKSRSLEQRLQELSKISPEAHALANIRIAWDRLSAATRAEVISGLRETLSTLPPAVRNAVLA